MRIAAVALLVVALGAHAIARSQRRRQAGDERVLFGRSVDEPAPTSSDPVGPRSMQDLIGALATPGGLSRLAGAAAIVLLMADQLFAPRPARSTHSLQGVTSQITSERGVETQPTLSPDGFVAYRAEIDGTGDILVRRIGSDHAHNLTAHLNADESDPAFSPDGRQIAFRSTYRNGGIFLVDRDGGPVRRLTNIGASPAWTPDGRSIVFATRSSLDPRSWTGPSEGWIVDVKFGSVLRLVQQDFRQPAVSPDGRRIAYWTSSRPRPGTSRMYPGIWTAGIDGRHARPVSRGVSRDWSPVWSPEGDYIYFLSDRGGRTSIWRVSIHRETGRPIGQPVRLAVSSEHAAHLAISRDGRHLTWSTLEWSPTLFRVPFVADTRSTRGEPAPVESGSIVWRCAEPSPDGGSIAFASSSPNRDIYILRVGDGALRAVTSDAAVEGCPRWSPDGRRIIFHSDAGGTATLWMAAGDGTALEHVGASLGELTSPVWAPDSRAVAAWDSRASALRLVRLAGGRRASSEQLAVPPHPFTPIDWSPDGSLIAGTAAGSLWLYTVASNTYEPLLSGTAPTWLSTSRRLLFASDGRLMMLDLASRYTREIFSVPDLHLDAPFLSPDDRHLYFNQNTAEANLWMLVLN